MLGRALRLFLKIIPSEAHVRILQGPLRGNRWIKGSGVNGYWLGTYELEKQKAFAHIVKLGDVVYDIGAHVGFYTLLASNLVGDTGKVFAFEPLPRNSAYLRKHLALNHRTNAKLFESAVGAQGGAALLAESESSFSGRIGEKGELPVAIVSIDELVARSEMEPPDIIKIDVEGGEISVLRGAEKMLRAHRPTILLATHGSIAHAACLAFLKNIGYSCSPLGGGDLYDTDEIVAVASPVLQQRQ